MWFHNPRPPDLSLCKTYNWYHHHGFDPWVVIMFSIRLGCFFWDSVLVFKYVTDLLLVYFFVTVCHISVSVLFETAVCLSGWLVVVILLCFLLPYFVAYFGSGLCFQKLIFSAYFRKYEQKGQFFLFFYFFSCSFYAYFRKY